MKEKIKNAILTILTKKRREGEVLPYATSIEVAHLLKMNALEVEEQAKGIEGIIKGKTINHGYYYEADEELTVENVKKHPRFHPRCGTSFIVIMLLLGIIIGLFVPQFTELGVWGTVLRSAIKILLLPLTIGVGYELIKICGKHDNAFTRIIAAPGLWAQRITTREPDDDIIEVAIAAITPVIPDDGSDIINCK